MESAQLLDSLLGTWRRHQEILLYLLERIPERGLGALPMGSRGREVARQFAHLDRIRQGWVHFHLTGKRPKLSRQHRGQGPSKAALKQLLRRSGAGVEAFLAVR
jgi:hypothetical protein